MKQIDAFSYEFNTHYVEDTNTTYLILRARQNDKTLYDCIVNHHDGKPSKKIMDKMVSDYVRIAINKGHRKFDDAKGGK